jgi:alpha-1,3-rhamnosyl/mannosyltransferase
MRLILAADAIFPPLTGIGRYAFELATRLPNVAEIEEVRYLGLFGWVSVPRIAPPETMASSLTASTWYAALRRTMAARPWAVSVYDAVSEARRGRLLRKVRGGAVFHSPNYFLPPYEGPSVATVHDLSIYRFPDTHRAAQRRYFDLAFERSLARADALITVSEAVRRELIADCAIDPARVTAIHHGVDGVFRPRDAQRLLPVLLRYGLQPAGFTLSVATVEPRKKLDRLVAAYACLPDPLRRRYPLVLAGSAGWLNDHVRKAIDRGRSEGWLHYLGYVPQDDLPALYAGARALALISIYEGFGFPVLEAMASGIPVLTSNVSALPEVAGGAALLVDPDDVPAVSSQLERLLTDEPWRACAAAAGLRRARQFTWERCVQRTVEVYFSAQRRHGHSG